MHIREQPATFPQYLWAAFTAQRPEPDDPALLLETMTR